MYTYIEDHYLYVLNHRTGRIYKIICAEHDANELMIVHHDTLSFNADVMKKIVDTNANIVKES